jgi:predicted PurR-regulated permease PerM
MQHRTLRIIILSLIGLAVGAFLYYIRPLLVPFAIAALMAYMIFPLVRSLEARGVKRSTAIITVYAAGLFHYILIQPFHSSCFRRQVR